MVANSQKAMTRGGELELPYKTYKIYERNPGLCHTWCNLPLWASVRPRWNDGSPRLRDDAMEWFTFCTCMDHCCARIKYPLIKTEDNLLKRWLLLPSFNLVLGGQNLQSWLTISLMVVDPTSSPASTELWSTEVVTDMLTFAITKRTVKNTKNQILTVFGGVAPSSGLRRSVYAFRGNEACSGDSTHVQPMFRQVTHNKITRITCTPPGLY